MPSVPGRGRKEEATKSRNLLLLRSGVTLSLLVSAVSVQVRGPDLVLSVGFQYLYVAVVLSYGWLLTRYAFWGGGEIPLPFLLLQAIVDVTFVSLIVFVAPSASFAAQGQELVRSRGPLRKPGCSGPEVSA